MAAFAVMVLGFSQVPAAAAIYTWMNRDINPTGIRYYDHAFNSQADSFSRTGIQGEIDGASGPVWRTKVWFGEYSNTGEENAAVSGPRSFIKTSASFTFLPGTIPEDRQRVRAWLLDARMAGARIEAPSELSESQRIMNAADVKSVTTNSIPGVQIRREGSVQGVQYWSGEAKGHQCLFVVDGEYVGSTCVDNDQFDESALRMEMTGPGLSAQGVLIPDGMKVKEDLKTVNAELISEHLLVRSDGGPATIDLVSAHPAGEAISVTLGEIDEGTTGSEH